MSPIPKFRAAAVQAEPVWFNLDATIDVTETLVADAARQGARLVAFPEVWLPGYPVFIWMQDEAWQAPHRARYADSCLEIGGAQHRRLEAIAKRHDMIVVLGFSERAGNALYMSQMMIDACGSTVMARRKLKPSGLEATFYSSGGPEQLKVVDTAVGRIGALNCSEHRRPALRHAMYTQGEQLHVASWPAFGLQPVREAVSGLLQRYDDWPRYGILPDVVSMESGACMTTTRAYAREGGLFVLAPTMTIGEAFSRSLGDEVAPQLHVGAGATHIFDPRGEELAAPFPPDQNGLLLAEIDYAQLRAVHDPDPFFERVPLADYQKRTEWGQGL